MGLAIGNGLNFLRTKMRPLLPRPSFGRAESEQNGDLATQDYAVTLSLQHLYHITMATDSILAHIYVMQCGNGMVGGYHRLQTATAC